MRLIKTILVLFLFSFLLNACKKDLSVDNTTNITSENGKIIIPDNFFKEAPLPGVQNSEITNNSSSFTATSSLVNGDPADNGDDPVILGAQLANPYTVPNMQQAFNTLYGNGTTLTANNLYVRFKPTNTDQLSTLEDNTDLELQDYPMDYEVTQDGDYYQDPSIPTESIPWLYSSVPTGFVAPAGIQFEIISPLYIPTADTLLETMAESIAAGAAYRTSIVNGNRVITRLDQKAESLIIPIISRPYCQEGYHLVLDDNGGGWICVPNNCPEGYYWDGTRCAPISPPPPPPPPLLPPGIYVEEQTVCNQPTRTLPLRQARMVAKRWFKIWRGYTDDNGRFNVTKNFKNKVKVIVKTKNGNAKVSKVRGIRIWQMLFPCKKRIGVFKGSELSTLRYVFGKPTDGSASNKELAYWSAATTHNCVLEFRQYSTEFGLGQIPDNLKIMVTNWGFMENAGATPMWNKCNNSIVPASYATFFIANSNFITAGLTVLTTVLKNQMDVIVGYKSTDYNCFLTSSQLRSVVYHELGHTQHFNQAGCDFWTQYRNAIVTELSKLNQVNFHPYGTGNDATTAPVIATGEMWGNHCEKWYSERHYGNGGVVAANFNSFLQGQFFLNNSVAGLNANYSAIESFNPNRPQDVHRWIPQGLPYDLFDNRNDFPNPITDNVAGFTINQSFNALQPDVRSITAFRDRLLQQNGNNQQAQVNQLFQQYGY